MAVQCELCPKECILEVNQRGDCRARVNIGGKLTALTYGYPCSIHVDPVEKKPLFHFYPASSIFSIATAGCNLHCKNCQNWQISQANPEDVKAYKLSPRDIVNITLKEKCSMIAYTYSEPVVFYEYVMDTAAIARKHLLKNVLVTAGYINQKPLKKILKVIDAANVDLKYFDEKLYRKMSSGSLKPVLDTLVTCKELGTWLEITHLIIPTINDNFIEIRKMCKWIVSNLGPDVPLHFSRFQPHYFLKNLPPTPLKTLLTAMEIAKEEGLHFAYVGNVWGQDLENTYCPYDNRLLIRRVGYKVVENNIKNGKCGFCGKSVAGRWEL